ncbi:MAG: hypothetical protein ACX930_06395 [Erythrobacter sp.]
MNEIETREEERAARRFLMMNLARIGGVIVLGAGISMTREVLPGPYWLGVVLAVAGVATFFFVPTMLVKRWKASDQGDQ